MRKFVGRCYRALRLWDGKGGTGGQREKFNYGAVRIEVLAGPIVVEILELRILQRRPR